METRTERVVIETARHRFVGELTLPREGYRSRLSDLLNRGDQSFLSLTNATLEGLSPLDAEPPVELDFVAIGIGQIDLVYPAPG